MGIHGPPSTFWEFMAQDGVFGHLSTQGLVFEMADMGKNGGFSPKPPQYVDKKEKAKKFQNFPDIFDLLRKDGGKGTDQSAKTRRIKPLCMDLIRI